MISDQYSTHSIEVYSQYQESAWACEINRSTPNPYCDFTSRHKMFLHKSVRISVRYWSLWVSQEGLEKVHFGPMCVTEQYFEEQSVLFLKILTRKGTRPHPLMMESITKIATGECTHWWVVYVTPDQKRMLYKVSIFCIL